MKRIGQQSRLPYPLWKYFVGPGRKSNICNPPPEILQAEDLQQAVQLAQAAAAPGDVVTLSPACAAFDQFQNFMVRGAKFKELVRAL